jgi:hypothetical protein
MTSITSVAVGTPNAHTGAGKSVSWATLNGSGDSFVFNAASGYSILVLKNPTGGTISGVNIVGSGASTAELVPGIGAVNATIGITVNSIAAGASRVIWLDRYAVYLSGTITITGGTGLKAIIFTADP